MIENKDFEKLISAQDSEASFFYCDPPYFSTESYYENVSFTTADHERLRDSLKNISGKFLVSYNDCPEIREIDDSNENIHVISGLLGVVEIKTDKRTVMDYFLEPIVKGFGESLKEK